MAKSAIHTLTTPQDRALEASRQVALVVGASLVVALCARITIPLMPLTPVPLTVQNLGVLLVGMMLGSRRGFAALALYLAEGAVGLPVFNPTGPGGIAQLLGPTGGFLMVYPFVAFLAGYVFERGTKTFLRGAVAGFLAEILLFAGGLTWLYASRIRWRRLPILACTGSWPLKSSKSCWPPPLPFAGAAVPLEAQSSSRFLEYADDRSIRNRKRRGAVSAGVREITVAHSPDSDDAFMFYGLATNKVRTPGLRFTHTLCDIETLNQKAREGVYDVSAISFHAYPIRSG